MTTRYVISYLNKDGCRMIAGACQGRNTKATQKEAKKYLRDFLKNNSEENLISIFGKQAMGTFKVSAVECYPGHNDPKGPYINEELNPGQVCVTGYMKELLSRVGKT